MVANISNLFNANLIEFGIFSSIKKVSSAYCPIFISLLPIFIPRISCSIILLFGLHLTYEQYHDTKSPNWVSFTFIHVTSVQTGWDNFLVAKSWREGTGYFAALCYIQRYVFAQRYILRWKISGPLSPNITLPVVTRWRPEIYLWMTASIIGCLGLKSVNYERLHSFLWDFQNWMKLWSFIHLWRTSSISGGRQQICQQNINVCQIWETLQVTEYQTAVTRPFSCQFHKKRFSITKTECMTSKLQNSNHITNTCDTVWLMIAFACENVQNWHHDKFMGPLPWLLNFRTCKLKKRTDSIFLSIYSA